MIYRISNFCVSKLFLEDCVDKLMLFVQIFPVWFDKTVSLEFFSFIKCKTRHTICITMIYLALFPSHIAYVEVTRNRYTRSDRWRQIMFISVYFMTSTCGRLSNCSNKSFIEILWCLLKAIFSCLCSIYSTLERRIRLLLILSFGFR